MMTFEEKEQIKQEYQKLKEVYKSLKKELLSTEPDSFERYDILCELSILGEQIKDIRRKLIDSKFQKYYPSTILYNFIFGEEEEHRIGGR